MKDEGRSAPSPVFRPKRMSYVQVEVGLQEWSRHSYVGRQLGGRIMR
jgi:hypothetical protein